MVSDHMWIDNEDVIKLINVEGYHIIYKEYDDRIRPKPGLKLFVTAKTIFYSNGLKELNLGNL